MWKWHTIAARKASWDQAKASNYAKIGKIIQLAAKNWADPTMNPSLDLALQKAKQYNLPRDVVDKAIKKWSWQLKGEDLQEVMFEWYGPGGVAVLIKALTDNTNRTSPNIKILLSKFWWSLWEPGSVSWQFMQKWVFIIDGKFEIINEKWNDVEKIYPLEMEEAEMELMDMDVEDVEDVDDEDWNLILTVDRNSFITVRDCLKSTGYHIVEAGIHYLPDNTVSLSSEDAEQLQLMLDNLDEDEDVDCVYSNIQ
jgi:YebC/PmpR family DNA-binding regulatory protein